jgi:hypothetical protein
MITNIYFSFIFLNNNKISNETNSVDCHSWIYSHLLKQPGFNISNAYGFGFYKDYTLFFRRR